MSNKLSQLVAKVNGAKVPPYVKQCLLSGAFNFKVKFAATSGIRIAALSTTESTVHLKNRIRVQNHIGGIHACGMAILAESATGAVFGMNVPDTHIPVIKSMKIDFKRRAVGDLKAVARLTDEQIREIQTTDKGSTSVQVAITDSSGKEPIECDMIWAWTSKIRKPKV